MFKSKSGLLLAESIRSKTAMVVFWILAYGEGMTARKIRLKSGIRVPELHRCHITDCLRLLYYLIDNEGRDAYDVRRLITYRHSSFVDHSRPSVAPRARSLHIVSSCLLLQTVVHSQQLANSSTANAPPYLVQNALRERHTRSASGGERWRRQATKSGF